MMAKKPTLKQVLAAHAQCVALDSARRVNSALDCLAQSHIVTDDGWQQIG